MSKQAFCMFTVFAVKKVYGLIMMVAFLCLIGVPLSTTFAASNLEEGIEELAQQISKNMTEKGKKAIAVVEFSDLDGNITAFGQFLAEELITQLFIISPGQFEVVERRQLMKVLSEQRLTMSGLLDAKAMESVGKILGIEAIVTGSVADLGSAVKVNARLIGVDTAKVFAVAATKIPKIDIVKDLLEKEAAPVQFYPEPSSTSSQRPIQRLGTDRKSKSQDFGNFRIEIESLKVMADGGIMVALSYINLADKEFEITLDYPPKERAFAVDSTGNEYELVKSSGMARRYDDPNYDIRSPTRRAHWHSSFLLTPPNKKVRASFLFKSVNESKQEVNSTGKNPQTFTITVGHYARPTKDFDPKKLKGAFSFSATISNVKPD